MKNDKEIVGTLLGFDDFVNMVLEDVTEYESTPEGRRVTKLDQILLNGNNITMVSSQKAFYTMRRSLGYLDCAGVLTKLLLGREYKPCRGTFSQFHQKSNAL